MMNNIETIWEHNLFILKGERGEFCLVWNLDFWARALHSYFNFRRGL